jgi:hypothetical protein
MKAEEWKRSASSDICNPPAFRAACSLPRASRPVALVARQAVGPTATCRHAQGVCDRTAFSVQGGSLVGDVIRRARDFSLFRSRLRLAIEDIIVSAFFLL